MRAVLTPDPVAGMNHDDVGAFTAAHLALARLPLSRWVPFDGLSANARELRVPLAGDP